MFKFKTKKVFEKFNKMDRKQAYTIGAIVVVLVVALILLLSSMKEEDDSFAGMNARGYDLAQMPFATDEAEKYLLDNVYSDMKENGSSLLYTPQEKEERQAEDAEDSESTPLEIAESGDDDGSDDYGSSRDGSYGSGSYGGYGGYGGRGGGGGKTEVGTLSSSGMASAGGSGISSTYGPSGDFRQFKGREDRGKERPVELKTSDARRTLAQFRSGSHAAARINENKMRNAGKALFGGEVRGSDAFTKDGVDLSKLQEGGLSLDTSAPPTTTDLDNLDKKVADAAQKAKDDNNKKDDKKSWWEEMLIDLAKSSVKLIVDSFLGTAMDTLSTNWQASSARRGAKKGVYNDESDQLYAKAASGDADALNKIFSTPEDPNPVNNEESRLAKTKEFNEKYKNQKSFRKTGTGIVKKDPSIVEEANRKGDDAYDFAIGRATEHTKKITCPPCDSTTQRTVRTADSCYCEPIPAQ